ncbi:MAG: cytochrome c biogenesis protein CcdA [Planctomycetota bacterium]
MANLLRIILAVSLTASASAQVMMPSTSGGGPDAVEAAAVFMADRVAAGGPTAVAVVIDIAETFHINPDPPRAGPEWFAAQYPTTLRVVSVPEGVRVGEPVFPEPKPYAVEYTDRPIPVHEGRVVVYVPLLLDAEAAEIPGAGPIELKFELEYQACDPRVCYMPTSVELTATAEVAAAGTDPGEAPAQRDELFADFDPSVWAAMSGGAGPAPDPEPEAAVSTESDGSLWVKLLLALGAGFLLNFTPCVLPVVPLKVMSLAQHGGDGAGGRRRTVVLALVMAAGVVAFWMAIALAIVSLKQFGTVNQLFQYPAFNLAVGVVIAALAVSMLGLFTINLPRAVYQINPTGDTIAGSFGFGVMTAVLATPCAGPLMGGAVFWATQQGVATVLIVFAALGFGMALPYLALTLFPGLVAKLPRAGAGSELLKQTMGVLMLAAAAFFIGIGIVALTADGTAATSQAYWWAVGLLIAAAGGWLLLRGLTKVATTAKGRALVAVSGLALVFAGGWVGYDQSRPGGSSAVAADGGETDGIPWVFYTPDRLAEVRAAGRAVLLDFTADWCLNCKVLERTVLDSERVTSLLRGPGVVPMKVDLTSARNVAGNDLLREMGRVTIPLLVVLDAEGDEVFKADFYTIDQVATAIGTATGDVETEALADAQR